jgi:hypothetical protein
LFFISKSDILHLVKISVAKRKFRFLRRACGAAKPAGDIPRTKRAETNSGILLKISSS